MLNIRKIGVIGRTYRNLGRYRQILSVLFKYGFDEFVDILKIEQYLEISLPMLFKKEAKVSEKLSRPERIRRVLEELGPTFIKFGQILSTRPDLIPLEYIKELAKLQDDVPSFTYEEVCEVITKELGQPPEVVFQAFEKEPFAAASIGQVHRARLPNNEDVVVKVQRPGIQEIIETDLEIMLHLASLMERHLEEFEVQRPTRIVSVFARSIEKEINYLLEAANIERFARQFLADQTVYVPKVYRQYSTKRVITMEFVDGIKASEIETLQEGGYDLKMLASSGAALIMKQIFVHGFFHADPHPGNLFILPGNIICFLDFGMMGRISRKERTDFADLVMRVVSRDEKKVVDSILKITYQHDQPDRETLEIDTAELMDRYVGFPLKDLEVGVVMHHLLEIISRHRLSLKPNFYLLVKATSTIETVGGMLDPDFDIIQHAEPFIKKIQMERFNPRKIMGDIIESGTELVQLFHEIPAGLRDVLSLTRQGRIKIEFEHRGLESLYEHLEQITNRLAFAIVLAAQIIGSALIVLADLPPKWNGIPIIGLVGFLLAGIMGFWLLVSMLRHGKM
ncbi:MAG: AarF/ABC1/UbiB kinase family protein [Proteobacteria bacterium]|nr:AarF/ABC1/UbiB kinase family protein [Pseudomonadota bacterium]MBU4298056.1 AarF/ABC1/UbiB kinase family protein [Pseudomonadota bacterium]MCG2746343.1 AarF/ABC1/UbiB kinase family protein [Desulfobulbaceae bacterium]